MPKFKMLRLNILDDYLAKNAFLYHFSETVDRINKVVKNLYIY